MPYRSDNRREYPWRPVHEVRRDDRNPRSADSYLTVHPSGDLAPRSREDSDLPAETARYAFRPPDSSRDIRRRSTDPGYYEGHAVEPYHHDRDHDYDDSESTSPRNGSGSVYYDEEKTRRRALSEQEKIVAALLGAALALGGKEIYDRRGAKKKGRGIKRKPLASAAVGALGAVVAYHGAEFYNKKATKEEKQVINIREYYSGEDDDPEGKMGKSSFLKSALDAAGLGGTVKALTGGSGNDDGQDTRSCGSSSKKMTRIQKAAMASLIAGAAEAFRVSRKPGNWESQKTKRVLTAAAGAGAINAFHNPEKHSKLRLLESVIGGLVGSKSGMFDSIIGGAAGNRIGAPDQSSVEEKRRAEQSRPQSRAHSFGGATGIAALTTAGLGAIGAKKMIDNHRERSQSHSRQRNADSYDSREGSPDRRNRSRSRSVGDSARKSLSKIGIGSYPDANARERRRDSDGYGDSQISRRHRGYDSDDGYDDEYSPSYRRGR